MVWAAPVFNDVAAVNNRKTVILADTEQGNTKRQAAAQQFYDRNNLYGPSSAVPKWKPCRRLCGLGFFFEKANEGNNKPTA